MMHELIEQMMHALTQRKLFNYTLETNTTKKMPISDQEFLTDPKNPLKKSYL